jgi:hypothetical protein
MVAGRVFAKATQTCAPSGEQLTRRCKIDNGDVIFYFELARLSEGGSDSGPDLGLLRYESACAVIATE